MGVFDHLIPGKQQQADPYSSNLIATESGGNPAAKNPASSAEGLGQFIDSTWGEFITERHPARLQTGENIYALKRDPAMSTEAIDWYKGKNRRHLEGKGLPTDDGSLSLAHFAGPAGAEKLLSASPEASAADILGPAAVKANPFLANMTAADAAEFGRKRADGGGEVQVAQTPSGVFDHLIPGLETKAPSMKRGSGTFDHLIPDAAPAGPEAEQPEQGPWGDGLDPTAPAAGVPIAASPDSLAVSPPVVPPAAPGPGTFDFIWKSRLNQRAAHLMAQTLAGGKDVPTAAAEFAQIQKERDLFEGDEDYKAGAKAHQAQLAGKAPQYDGITGALRFFYDHPKYNMETIGESVLPSLESAAGGAVGMAVGGLAGTPLGPAGVAAGATAGLGIGVAATSGFTEGMGKYMETLQEAGIDITNEQSLAGAFQNAELLAEAKRKALLKGLPVGFFDGITAYLGARGMGKTIVDAGSAAWMKVTGKAAAEKVATRQAIKEGAANLFLLEAPGGMLGEGVGEYAAEGEVDWINVMLEGVGEVAFSAPQVALEVAQARRGRETAPATDTRAFYSQATNIPTYEQAEIEGRSWYGFVDMPYQNEGQKFDDKGALIEDNTTQVGTRVFTDYTEAEERMGQNNPRQGKLVAVGANDVTATSADASTQTSDTQNPPTPRFVDPTTEPQARELWTKFAAGGAPGLYKEAVGLGLRLAPRGAVAEFVGDLSTSEILPKAEMPIRSDNISIVADTGGTPATVRLKGEGSLNLDTLLKDARFQVVPTVHGFTSLARHPRLEALAPALFEVTDPTVLAEIVKMGGWKSFFTEASQVASPLKATIDSYFNDGKIKLRPNASWATRMISHISYLEVKTALSKADAAAAIKDKHIAFMPRAKYLGGPELAFEDQSAESAGGLAGWSFDVTARVEDPNNVSLIFGASVTADQREAMVAWQKIAQRMVKNMDIKEKITLFIGRDIDRNELTGAHANFTLNHGQSGTMWQTNQGALMFVDTQSIHRMYQIAAHEFGHVIAYLKFSHLSPSHQAQIYAAYRRYMLVYRSGLQGNLAHQIQRSMSHSLPDATPYYMSFEEWFAEQTARWATTSSKPMTAAARFFKKLGLAIIKMARDFQKNFFGQGMSAKAEPIMQEWLDSVYAGEANWSAGVRHTFDEKTRSVNAKYGFGDIALQGESVKIMQAIHKGASPGGVSPGLLGAQLDKFNLVMKWGIGYQQLAQMNPQLRELQLYSELTQMMKIDSNNIMAGAETILKEHLRKLRRLKTNGKYQSERLGDFLFDMTEMVYLTPRERAQGIRRWPTQIEVQALSRQHQLSQEALVAFQQLRDSFAQVVLRGQEVAEIAARHVFANDPQQMRIAFGEAAVLARLLLAAPYFPMSRFGPWAVAVRTAAGGVKLFETYETQQEQAAAVKEAESQYPPSAGWSIVPSMLPDDVQQWVGMPPWFLDRLQELPGMTPTQKEWIKLLRFQVAPARSFTKHLLPRKKTAGYSRDVERVYARYMLSHARNYSRLKYQRLLEEQIDSLRAQAFQNTPGVHMEVKKRTEIANYLADHLANVLDPSADWHMLRSVVSVWHLGFMVASAALNMMQTPVMTFSFLASKFNDFKSVAALTKAATDITTFYKRGAYENMTGGEMVMLDYLIKRGDITESMAAELAGLGAGNALASHFGIGDAVHRGWLAFSDKAMLMFKLVEQWNRRVTARAAYKLAIAEPNNSWVLGLRNTYFLQFQAMQATGTWASDVEILATLAAQEAINKTHYDYSKEARPRFMRGRKGLLFAFYMFTQNTIFQLVHPENKGLFIRYALVMTFFAGAQGLLPDEAEDILSFIGRRFFGKDFNVAKAAREHLNMLVDPKTTDLILHGAGRYGFGIPAAMEMMGAPWAPEIDFSRLIDLRHIAPLPITKGLDMLDRGVDVEKQMSRFILDDLAGAGFGLPVNLLMALGNNELDASDLKRWENAVPRSMKHLMRAWRLSTERGERVGKSHYIMEYDKNDPQDVAEIVAQTMGFTSSRVSLGWDIHAAKQEIDIFWTSKRQALIDRAYRARIVDRDMEEFKAVRKTILDFNKEAPDKKYKISPDTLKRSFTSRIKRQQEQLQGYGPGIPPLIGKEVESQFPSIKRVSEQRLAPLVSQ